MIHQVSAFNYNFFIPHPRIWPLIFRERNKDERRRRRKEEARGGGKRREGRGKKRRRGQEERKENIDVREKHQWVSSYTLPNWGSNLQPSGVVNDTPTNWKYLAKAITFLLFLFITFFIIVFQVIIFILCKIPQLNIMWKDLFFHIEEIACKCHNWI